MVLSWCRMKQAQLRALSNQFKRCYFQIHGSSSVIRETRIGVANGPSLAFHKTGSEVGNYVRFFAAPVQVKPKYEEKEKGRPRMNEQISAQFVRLVSDEGHGVVSRHEALERARSLNVDLVEVQPDGKPPVCKLMNYNKDMYEKQAREKEQAKKKSDVVLRKGSMKEVRITTKIDKNDLQTKADGVRRSAERGHRVKCMAVGTPDQDLGGLLLRFSALLEDFSLVESGPIVEAKQAYIVIRHVKFGPLKKGKKVVALPKSPEKLDQSSDQSDLETEEGMVPEIAIKADSTNNFDITKTKNHDHIRKIAPETSNVDRIGSENRYASSGQKNASAPGPDNRYATMRPPNTSAPGSDNRYATTRPPNAPAPGPDNRYPTMRPGSDNRYATTRPPNPSGPGGRRFDPKNQNPGSNRQFDLNRQGPSEPNNGPQRGSGQVNRYNKGPSSQQPPSDYRADREYEAGFRR